MSVFIHNTIFVIQNGVKRNEGSIENQCGSSFVGMTKLLYFQSYNKFGHSIKYYLNKLYSKYAHFKKDF